MGDLIDRQAAIDAVSEACFELRGVFGRCEDALKALPSAQPEIIRCKDCKYREYGYCNLYLSFHRLTADMDYCSDAERKEE